MVSEKIVDIDADKDADFADILQLLAQFEVAAGTKIANHGMEDVKVGHCGGDAVELVHQPRLDIVEKLGAHRLGVWGASPFERSQKRIRESFCLKSRLWTACITNEKAHGYTVSISAFSCNTVEIVQISTLLEKQKRFISKNYKCLFLSSNIQ